MLRELLSQRSLEDVLVDFASGVDGVEIPTFDHIILGLFSVIVLQKEGGDGVHGTNCIKTMTY